jgi:dTDP-4-amino-4,6-dideoxygalactose transaminase
VAIWERYQRELKSLEDEGLVVLLDVRPQAQINGHIAAFRMVDPRQRGVVLEELHRRGIGASFHYVPLHSSPFAREQLGINVELPVTDLVSKSLIRLPLFPDMTADEQEYVIKNVQDVVRSKNP